MSEYFSRDYMSVIVDKAVDRIDASLKEIDRIFGRTAYGQRQASDEEVMEIASAMTTVFPPMPIMLPGGTVIVESPWILALDYVDGGPEFKRQWKRALRKEGDIEAGS